MSDIPRYNDVLPTDEQLDTEEAIASLIFYALERLPEDASGNDYEGLCADLGRDILRLALKKFRPDVFDRR